MIIESVNEDDNFDPTNLDHVLAMRSVSGVLAMLDRMGATGFAHVSTPDMRGRGEREVTVIVSPMDPKAGRYEVDAEVLPDGSVLGGPDGLMTLFVNNGRRASIRTIDARRIELRDALAQSWAPLVWDRLVAESASVPLQLHRCDLGGQTMAPPDSVRLSRGPAVFDETGVDMVDFWCPMAGGFRFAFSRDFGQYVSEFYTNRKETGHVFDFYDDRPTFIEERIDDGTWGLVRSFVSTCRHMAEKQLGDAGTNETL